MLNEFNSLQLFFNVVFAQTLITLTFQRFALHCDCKRVTEQKTIDTNNSAFNQCPTVPPRLATATRAKDFLFNARKVVVRKINKFRFTPFAFLFF